MDANQLDELREFTKNSKGAISVEYIDKMSGGRGDRPEFQEICRRLQAQVRLGGVLALDRFGREGTLATLQYLQKLDAAGVGWRSYQMTVLDHSRT